MAEIRKQSVIMEIIRYGLVGAVSTVIDMGLLNIGKKLLGWPVWLDVAIGFIGGTVNGYYMNSRWTFKYNTRGQEGIKFTQFAIVSAIGLGLTELIVNGYIVLIGASLNLAGHIVSEYNTGKLIAVVLVFAWNYIANKLWTFKSVKVQSMKV